ncbi:nitroreductase family protein [Polychytrium aggregatum]|uniref:nitroreductase family protein n=1 Tax=Polychytrium aggregatum TaxID=110093 RepID=UPI0022FEBDED|nr:nitroreductase family protein [Polychytrium aggregatum]KAI9208069.1 nitroreductase family protein [Polychytrium aggregatum]
MSQPFLDAVRARRSIYAIGKESPLPVAQIEEIIKQAVLHAPSSFNSQAGRVVLLIGKEHDDLWELIRSTLREVQSPEHFENTNGRLTGFQKGYGTILFFEDQAALNQFKDKYASYKDDFDSFSLQSSGILQYIVWTALEKEGYGATLQHYYKDGVAEKIRARWNLPDSWKLISEVPFGKPTGEPYPKQFQPVEERFKSFH